MFGGKNKKSSTANAVCGNKKCIHFSCHNILASQHVTGAVSHTQLANVHILYIGMSSMICCYIYKPEANHNNLGLFFRISSRESSHVAKLQGKSMFKDARFHAEQQIYLALNNKIDEFMELGKICIAFF